MEVAHDDPKEDAPIELLSLHPELVEAICRASGADGCAALMACSQKAFVLARSDAVWASLIEDEFACIAQLYPTFVEALRRRSGSSFGGLRALRGLVNGLVTARGPLQPRAGQRLDGGHRLSGGTAAMFRLVVNGTNGQSWGSIVLLGPSESAACPGLYLHPSSNKLHANVNWASGMADGLARCAPLEENVPYRVVLLSWRLHLNWFARLLVVREEADAIPIIDEEASVDRPPLKSGDGESSPIYVGDPFDSPGNSDGMGAAPCTVSDLVVLGLAGLPPKDEHRGPPPACMDVLLAVCEAAHPCLLSPMERIVDERRARLQDASHSTRPRSLFLVGNPPGCANCLEGEATVAGFDHCPHPLLCATCANSGGFRTRGSRHMALMHCRLCRSADVDAVVAA